MEHVSIFGLVCTIMCAFAKQSEVERISHASHIDSGKDKIGVDNVLAYMKTVSRISCANECLRSEMCLTFFYNKKSRECQIHGMGLPNEKNALVPSEGFKYYELNNRRRVGQSCLTSDDCIMSRSECKVSGICGCVNGYSLHPTTQTCEPGLVGQDCTVGSDCKVAGSECRTDNICGCKIGRSFQNRTQTCETDCTQYGNTFQSFSMQSISGHNTETHPNKSPEECKQLCINAVGFTCLSVDLSIKSDSTCYVQDVDASDVPSDHRLNTDYTHFQRDCA